MPEVWRGLLALAYAAPLALFLARNNHDDNFAYSEIFQRQATPDIAFVQLHRGAALCENLAFCYWAHKDAAVDVFNVSEQFKTGTRADSNLIHLISARHFGVIQLDTLQPFALGPHVRAALDRAYRVDHIDDNGVFLLAR